MTKYYLRMKTIMKFKYLNKIIEINFDKKYNIKIKKNIINMILQNEFYCKLIKNIETKINCKLCNKELQLKIIQATYNIKNNKPNITFMPIYKKCNSCFNPNSINYVQEKYHCDKNKALEIIHNRNKSPFYKENHKTTQDYYNYQKRDKEFCKKHNIDYDTLIKKQNYARSLEGYKDKYGEIEGLKKWKQYQKSKNSYINQSDRSLYKRHIICSGLNKKLGFNYSLNYFYKLVDYQFCCWIKSSLFIKYSLVQYLTDVCYTKYGLKIFNLNIDDILKYLVNKYPIIKYIYKTHIFELDLLGFDIKKYGTKMRAHYLITDSFGNKICSIGEFLFYRLLESQNLIKYIIFNKQYNNIRRYKYDLYISKINMYIEIMGSDDEDYIKNINYKKSMFNCLTIDIYDLDDINKKFTYILNTLKNKHFIEYDYYDLLDIKNICDCGIKNCIDISVENKYSFTLSNGVISHNSASGGLTPSLGRDENSFFSTRGVPLNAYTATAKELANNEELTNIIKVLNLDINNKENGISHDCIVLAEDADCDGSHIRGLYLGFFIKYARHLFEEHKIKYLKTPIAAILEKKNIVKYWFTLSDMNNYLSKHSIKNNQTLKYFKGLGSWRSDLLSNLINNNGGIENFLEDFEISEDSEKLLTDWIGESKENVQSRKEYLKDYQLDINKI